MTASTDIRSEPGDLNAVKLLADEIDRPVEEVNRIYSETFARLSKDARVKSYLVLLTCKIVRNELRK